MGVVEMASECPFVEPPAFIGKNIHAWFTTLPGVYTWTPQGGHLYVEDAQAMVDNFGIDTLDFQFSDAPKYSFFHDWSNGKGYEPKSRLLMVQWAKSIPKDRLERMVVRISDAAPALDRMGIATTAAALAIVGRYLDVVDDVKAASSEEIRVVAPRVKIR